MEFDLQRLELFRDLKIRKSELCDENTDALSLEDNMVQRVPLLPQHIITALEKYKSNEISQEHFFEWINTIWFDEFFEYCVDCIGCISNIVDSLEESHEAEIKLSDYQIDQYIQILLSIDDVTATENPAVEIKFCWKDHLLQIIVGFQVLYAAIKIAMILTYVVGGELSALINPITLFLLLPYLCILFLGSQFILEKPFAWYGITCSYLYWFYKNIIEFALLGFILLFGDSFSDFYKMPLPTRKLYYGAIPIAISLFIITFILKLLLKNETLERFNIKITSKWIRLLICTGLVAMASAMYFGFGFLLVKDWV